MSDSVNRQILLVEKPTGKLGPEHFRMVEGNVPEPKDGEVLVRTRVSLTLMRLSALVPEELPVEAVASVTARPSNFRP